MRLILPAAIAVGLTAAAIFFARGSEGSLPGAAITGERMLP